MKKIDDVVEHVLVNQPQTRDDDPLLFIRVAEHLGIAHYSKYDLLKALSYQTVQRTRRKLQEQKAELRGDSYIKRKHLEHEYREKYRPTTESQNTLPL